ncbi:hypothetical protein [Streptomyces pseudogriseolus]|uniref:hypothetical protein n=1 Tax=Streptomyces pseudogriseolus TaxID=36817 RepID=UPI000A3B952B
MTAVLFAVDPVRRPLLVRSRPVNREYVPLPEGTSEASAVLLAARDVRAGDLVVASFCGWMTEGTMTRSTWWMNTPYRADPAPWDPKCGCAECWTVRQVFGKPSTPAGRIVMTRDEWDGVCDVWDADEPLLVIPTALSPAAA